MSDLPAAAAHSTSRTASRLPADDPRRAEILAAHRDAVAAGEAGYLDPATGLFVFTAAYLTERGTCCDSKCRHCPYVA